MCHWELKSRYNYKANGSELVWIPQGANVFLYVVTHGVNPYFETIEKILKNISVGSTGAFQNRTILTLVFLTKYQNVKKSSRTCRTPNSSRIFAAALTFIGRINRTSPIGEEGLIHPPHISKQDKMTPLSLKGVRTKNVLHLRDWLPSLVSCLCYAYS